MPKPSRQKPILSAICDLLGEKISDSINYYKYKEPQIWKKVQFQKWTIFYNLTIVSTTDLFGCHNKPNFYAKLHLKIPASENKI